MLQIIRGFRAARDRDVVLIEDQGRLHSEANGRECLLEAIDIE